MDDFKPKNVIITLGIVALIIIVNFYLYTRGLTPGNHLLLVHLYYPLVIITAVFTNYSGMLIIVLVSSLANLIQLRQLLEVESVVVTLAYPFISFIIGHLITGIRRRQVRERIRAAALHHKAATEMNTLYQMSITLTSLTSLSSILRSMMRILSDELGSERSQLALVESDGANDQLPLLRVTATHGFDPEEEDGGIPKPWLEPMREVASSGKPKIISGRSEFVSPEEYAKGDEINFYCLPVKVRGEIIGVLSAEKLLLPGISYRDDLRFLEIVSSIIGQVIQINRMLDSIRDMVVYNDNILASMASGIVAFDMLGKVTIFNHVAEEIIGIKRSQALGKSYWALFASQEEMTQPIRQALGESEVGSNLEVALSREGESQLILNLSTSLLKNGEDQVIGAVASFSDISQVKKLEEEVKRTDRLATAGEMAAGLAHEIRNPLSGLRGSAQLIATELGEDDPRTEYTEVIVEEVDRVEGLIRKLLDLVKPISPDFKEGDVNEILTDTLSFVLKSVRNGEEFKIVRELAPSLPVITVDEESLRGAFMNILLNAFQAMPEGGVLSLRTELDGERSTVKIRVADTGPGIPSQERELIFNPFYTRRRGGTGLGLSVTGRIIAEHGGSIGVEGVPGNGAAFVISLPVMNKKKTNAKNEVF